VAYTRYSTPVYAVARKSFDIDYSDTLWFCLTFTCRPIGLP